MIGRRVEHRKFGRGTVQEVRHRGLELYVRFDDGLDRWVRREDIAFLSSSPVLEAIPPPPARVLTEEALQSRSMIEAFRLGIVPYGHIEKFTFGRDAEIQQITQWLNNEGMGTLVVEGGYGSGKSHLLDYLYALALREGYAVARVELDPNEAPPFKPKAVYRKLIETFRYKYSDNVRYFRDFLRALTEKAKYSLQSHYYLGRVISAIGTSQEEESLNWIEGRESFYWPTLYDQGTAANVYCYILSGIGWAAHYILSLKGLVLIMDEAECVDLGWYYWYQVNKGFNLIQGLSFLAGNDTRLRDERICEEYRPGIGRWFGKETQLIYHGRSPVRYCFQLPSCVKVAFAFTPTDMVEKLQQLGVRLLCLRLQPLSEGALKDIF
ncbi:MAG: BREX system ATP-binding domain-containing protein, partial [candidate division WOR-3 bacterium]